MQRSTTIINLIQLTLLIISASSLALHPPTFCGKIKLQNNKNSILNQILVCKSQTLYFRTSLGLFPISSINYETKTLTISHKYCSSSSLHYVSPKLLSLGFPTPQPNSLLLLNCSNQRKQQPPITASPHLYNCSTVSHCKVGETKSSTCWFIKDAEKLEMGFHPKHLNCSHYARIYKGFDEKVELGTRVSFDLPDKLPNICDECNKPQGNCGVGLKCICHPKRCKDKLINSGASMGPFFPCFVFFTIMMVFLV